ncbi:MAG: BspA family leucine-rich repeat surface protein, partial [Helicobacteraceae bacterium]|nr:BspA family leucine-rich repeat surface protein [Helicobacteraceae bacterium]
AVAIALSGCGGSGEFSDTDPSAGLVTGQLADGAIGNAEYKCASTVGFTDKEGYFTCPIGSEVNFYYGNFHIGGVSKLPSDKIVLIQDGLDVPRANTQNVDVVKLAIFLQSLDKNGDHSDGIFLDPNFKPDVPVGTTIKQLDNTQISAIIKKAGKVEVPQAQAIAELQVTTDNVVAGKGVDGKTIPPAPTPTPTPTPTPAPAPTCNMTLSGVYYDGNVVSAENNITLAIDSNITLVFSANIETSGSSITTEGGATATTITKTADKNITFVYNAPMSLNTNPLLDFSSTNVVSVVQGACTFTPPINIFSHPLTRAELDVLRDDYITKFTNDADSVETATAGELLANANTAAITDMSSFFINKGTFNLDIGDWNTSEVTTMEEMFLLALAFDQDIGDWNTSKVTNISYMFYGASVFNQDIGGWDTSKVASMELMFNSASAFDQSLNGWNTAEVTNMGQMFDGATSFDQSLSDWNTAKVTNMIKMFYGATSFNRPLSTVGVKWNVSLVTDMASMFNGATAFTNQDLSSWTPANVVDAANISAMFTGSGGGNTAPTLNTH